MIKRTLYFGNPAYIKVKDEQLVIDMPAQRNGEQSISESSKTVPIEDIGVVILDSPQITVTQTALSKLLTNNAAVVTCNEKHMPAGLLLPLEGNTLQSERFKSQIESSLPLKKQLWQQTVQAKIANQAALLKKQGIDVEPMGYWERSVRSGDPDNYEGRAAAYYWKNIFDGKISDGFIRGRFEDEPNNLLNYGYIISPKY